MANSSPWFELGRRFKFLLFAIIIYRLGAHVTLPGIDLSKLHELFNVTSSGILGMFNMFSGGAFARLTIFSLGVMPYISASIAIQLLSSVVPTLKALRKDGEKGRIKISNYTRYLTLILASAQSFALARWVVSQNVVDIPAAVFIPIVILTLTTGTLFLMWLGEQITERAIGNGISLIIFFGIVCRMPQAIVQVFSQTRSGQMSVGVLLAVLALIVSVTLFVVFVERGQRRIPIHHARQSSARGVYGQQTSHLPLKLNLSGVIPPIFASSLIIIPTSMFRWLAVHTQASGVADIAAMVSPGEPLYMLIFASLVIFFCFFYSAMVFNSRETAENLKKSGAFVPGIRPGPATAKYIDFVLERLTLCGALYIAAVALLPQFMIVAWHVPFYFGGTSLLIVVVVMMDLIAQIQTFTMQYKYKSVLGKGVGPLGQPT